MQTFDVIIIGGGASGSMCAMSANKKYSVAIIDEQNLSAKKLLVTGNGRCNISNIGISSEFYNQNIDSFLSEFSSKDTIGFFADLGLICYSDNESRMYPVSNSAKSVVDIINLQLLKRKVNKFSEEKVIDIQKENDKFVVTTDKNKFVATKMVIATGGNSFNQMTKNFNINLSPLSPSLVALKTKENTAKLSGLRLSDVVVTAKYGTTTKNQTGEVLLKDNGLSGIAIFNLSTIFARNHDFKGTIGIDLLPNYTETKLEKFLFKLKTKFEKADEFLLGILNKQIANEILYRAKINPEMNASDLTNSDLLKIAKTIKQLEFTICGCYDNNQVFSGGVKLDELTESLESKTVPNLYFCGEVIDVDGECGGFNLQWAWTSGHIVGTKL